LIVGVTQLATHSLLRAHVVLNPILRVLWQVQLLPCAVQDFSLTVGTSEKNLEGASQAKRATQLATHCPLHAHLVVNPILPVLREVQRLLCAVRHFSWTLGIASTEKNLASALLGRTARVLLDLCQVLLLQVLEEVRFLRLEKQDFSLRGTSEKLESASEAQNTQLATHCPLHAHLVVNPILPVLREVQRLLCAVQEFLWTLLAVPIPKEMALHRVLGEVPDRCPAI